MTKAEFLKMVEDECDLFPADSADHNSYGAGLQAGIKDGWLTASKWWAEQMRDVYKYNFKRGERSKILDLAEELLEDEKK